MNLGLYLVGKGQPLTRVRRGRTTHAKRGHLVPVYNTASRFPTHSALCGIRPVGIQGWRWIDDGEDCATCTAQARHKLSVGELVIASPAVVAEFERQRAANLGDRQARAVRVDARLAVEVHRPRGSVVGSADTKRTLHLVDCPIVGAYDRPMVSLPVEEVRRQYNADGRRTDFCQECKPGHVLDNERLRPHTLTEARTRSERAGYLARDRYQRRARNPHRSFAFRTLPHDGSKHFDDCPANPDELLHGDVTEPDYGRCKCYERYATARPGERPDDDFSPDWA